MIKNRYENAIENFRKINEERFKNLPERDDENYIDYLKVKTNVKYFKDDQFKMDAFEFYKEFKLYQELANLDQESQYAHHAVEIKGLLPRKNEACIYCSFHLGSYRLPNFILVKEEVDFTLLISEDDLSRSRDIYIDFFELLKKQCQKEASFSVINAEDPRIGIQMIRALKEGNSLMVYLDGNTGVGGMSRKDDKLMPINFLGKTILARKGIAYISYLLNVPIIPIVSYRTNLLNATVEFLPALRPDKSIEKETFTKQTTQHLFDIFSTYLLEYPTQWETWHYVNEFLDVKELSLPKNEAAYKEHQTYIYDVQRWGLFIKDQIHFLFDTRSYKCIKIPEPLWRLLYTVEKKEVENTSLLELLKENLKNQLIQLGVLIPV